MVTPPPPRNLNNIEQELLIRSSDTVVLLGGLGNQMFQYAFMLGMQNLYPDRVFKIDIYSDYSLLSKSCDFELARVFAIPESEIFPKYLTEQNEYRERPLFIEDPHNSGALVFNQEVMKLNPELEPQIFWGYWQSECYFAHIREQVLDLFKFRALDAENQNLSDEIFRVNSVAVHIRRGDYVNTVFDVLDMHYYKQAMDKMAKALFEPPIFYIFSNDQNYCKQQFAQLEQDFQIRYVCGNFGENSWKDMALMQKAHHFIIANSSFSWWAAYLGDCSDKKVFAPRQWFVSFRNSYFTKYISSPKYNISDICPKEWILLDNLNRPYSIKMWILIRILIKHIINKFICKVAKILREHSFFVGRFIYRKLRRHFANKNW